MTRVVFGKFLELIGLFIVTVGFFLGITGSVHLHFELMALCLGGAVFYTGFSLERSQRK